MPTFVGTSSGDDRCLRCRPDAKVGLDHRRRVRSRTELERVAGIKVGKRSVVDQSPNPIACLVLRDPLLVHQLPLRHFDRST